MILHVFLALSVAIVIYNCYWKRRHLPPGPMPWPIVGNIPALKNASGRPPYEILRGWRRRYGDVFTVWVGEVPNICVAEYGLIYDAFVRDGDSYTGRLKFQAITDIFRGGTFGLVFIDGEDWRRQRRFTLAVLRDFGMGKNLMQQKIIGELEHLFHKFDQHADDNRPLKIGRHFDVCVGSIISMILFGFRYDDDRLEKFFLIRDSIAEILRLHSHPMVVLLFWKANFFRWLPKFSTYFARLCQLRDILFGFIDAQIERHTDNLANRSADDDEPPSDFVDAYVQEMWRETTAGQNPAYFNRDQLRNVILDLLITGQDTTSLTLGFTVLYILHNPEVQERLHAELDAIGGDFVTYDDRVQLPYLNAVLSHFNAVILFGVLLSSQESQRLTNLLPENLFHKTTRDVTIKNYQIACGTVITPQISCVLYDEKIFPNPYTFLPERFLNVDGKSVKRVDEFIPFSLGKRACIGENLAKMELFLIIANTFKRYMIKPIDENNLPILDKSAGLTVHYQPYECFLDRR